MPFSFPSSPTVGQLSRQNGRIYRWNGYSWDLLSDSFQSIKALLVGGGGPGGYGGTNGGSVDLAGGGGGAGAFVELTSVNISLNTPYTISIGAGGAISSSVPVNNGNFSRFDVYYAIGGGCGGGIATLARIGNSGGSGGGSGSYMGANTFGKTMIPLYGNNGGNGAFTGFYNAAGGGGGANTAGNNNAGTAGGSGGNGTTSSIPNTSATPPANTNTFCGGGGGAGAAVSGSSGSGGTGGGGTGAVSSPSRASTAGTANTGGGGGGGYNGATLVSSNGGSGIVVLRFSSTLNYTVGVGLTYTSSTSENETILVFTAGTDTITFS